MWRKVVQDFQDTRSADEGLVEWFLKRQAGTKTKLAVAGLVWILRLWLWFHPAAYISLFKLALILSILIMLWEIGDFLLKRRSK